MKIQCLLCKEIVEIGCFKIVDDAIQIHCASCQQYFQVATTGIQTHWVDSTITLETVPKTVPPIHSSPELALSSHETETCPKCGRDVEKGESACADCGLLRSRFAGFASASRAIDPALEILWERCVQNWGDPDTHERFIAQASKSEAFAEAARHYRDHKKHHPLDSIAPSRLERLTKMAEVALLTKRPTVATDDVGAGRYRGVVILLALMLIVGAAAGVYTMFKKKSDIGTRTPISRPVSR